MLLWWYNKTQRELIWAKPNMITPSACTYPLGLKAVTKYVSFGRDHGMLGCSPWLIIGAATLYIVRWHQYCDEFVLVYVCNMYVCMWLHVWVDCCWTHDEEPLPLPVFVHADIVWWHQFACPQSAQSFWLYVVTKYSGWLYLSLRPKF